jgi:hypothetical protein
MSEPTYSPQMIRVLSDSSAALTEATRDFDQAFVRIGQVRETAPVTDFNMHPFEIAKTVYEVMLVITKIGGTIQFANWAYTKIKSMTAGQPALVIQVGDQRIELTAKADPDLIKKLVQSSLAIREPPDSTKPE